MKRIEKPGLESDLGYRKVHLGHYLAPLVTKPYDGTMVAFRERPL